MKSRRFTYLLFSFAILLLGAASSCQKDSDVKDPDVVKASLSDSSVLSSPGNYLAASGTLSIKFNDSTYTFDAASDSIAFINVHVDENNRYFGITAINKSHSMSFGISSSGYVYSNIKRGVAGSQFLLNASDQQPALQYSLSKYTGEKDFGTIHIIKYNTGNQLAKGTFFTFLAKDDKVNSPFYKVEGTFDLQLTDTLAKRPAGQ